MDRFGVADVAYFGTQTTLKFAHAFQELN